MLICLAASVLLSSSSLHMRLAGSRRYDKAGWIYVRLEGSPERVGFQHGYLLAKEIDDVIKVEKVLEGHDKKGDAEKVYGEQRADAMRLLWPRIPAEYRQELRGIADGVRARGYSYGLADIVYHAGATDIDYYVDWRNHIHPKSSATDHCSAVVATGSATKDGKIVMAHTDWDDYAHGERNNIILDIHPEKGERILMDSMPGRIDSGDDFAINSAGIMLTETTISDFIGFDPAGVPEFVRMREAMQYGRSIDDVYRWFASRNNGAYANMWLIGDRKTNEIASLELGLKNVILHRTDDGAITSCNSPIDPKLTAEECFPKKEWTSHPARTQRWADLMARDKGKIDAELGKAYMSDHDDATSQKQGPNMGDLCGHGDVDPRTKFAPSGSSEGKVVTSDLCAHMEFWARMGHPCGGAFSAAAFLKAHPEYAWQKSVLKDMPSEPWVMIGALGVR